MKIPTTLLFLLLFFNTASAQIYESVKRANFTEIGTEKYECLYEYKLNTTTDENEAASVISTTILQIGDKLAKFEDYNTYLLDSVTQVNTDFDTKTTYAKQYFSATNYFDQEIIQNTQAKNITTIDCITSVFYKYDEKFSTMEWELTDDTLTVCGYLCNKATAKYGGRTWTAWYTSELPIPNGPWKLCGLPGLIMKAEDSEGIHQFTAYSFRKGNLPILNYNDAVTVKAKREKILSLKKQYTSYKNPLRAFDISSIKSVQGYGAQSKERNVIVNGIVIRYRYNKHVPLELE